MMTPPSLENVQDAGRTARPLVDDVRALGPWWQNLELPDGTQTAPELPHGDQSRARWSQLAPLLPSAMHGWRVLDVACNAGFHSIELARRGALVTALDTDGHCLAQARWAARQWGLTQRVEVRRGSVYDLAHEAEEFDVTCCLGALDGVRYRQLALDMLRRITRRMLLLGVREESAGFRDMAAAAGFRVSAEPAEGLMLCEPDSAEPRWSSESRTRELLRVTGSQDD